MRSDNASLEASPVIGDSSQTVSGAGQSGTTPSDAAHPTVARSLWREPLLHFVVLGALVFAADLILHPPANDERVITVTKALRQSFIDNFDEDKERVPSDADLQKMIESWVASEILYREGKRSKSI